MKKVFITLFICLAAIISSACTANNTDLNNPGRVTTTRSGAWTAAPARTRATTRRTTPYRTTTPRTNRNSDINRNADINRNTTTNRSTGMNRNTNTNTNTNRNIDATGRTGNTVIPSPSRIDDNGGSLNRAARSTTPSTHNNSLWQDSSEEDLRTNHGNYPTIAHIPTGYTLGDVKKTASESTTNKSRSAATESTNMNCRLSYTKAGADPIILTVERNRGTVPAERMNKANKVDIMGTTGYETRTGNQRELTWAKNNTLYHLTAPESISDHEFHSCAKSIKTF